MEFEHTENLSGAPGGCTHTQAKLESRIFITCTIKNTKLLVGSIGKSGGLAIILSISFTIWVATSVANTASSTGITTVTQLSYFNTR